MTSVEKRNGKKGVRIAADKFGMTEMLTTRNGFQWNGFEADRELLEMIRDSINEWLGSTQETGVARTFTAAGPEQGMSTMCECGQPFAKHIAQDSAGNSCVCP